MLILTCNVGKLLFVSKLLYELLNWHNMLSHMCVWHFIWCCVYQYCFLLTQQTMRTGIGQHFFTLRQSSTCGRSAVNCYYTQEWFMLHAQKTVRACFHASWQRIKDSMQCRNSWCNLWKTRVSGRVMLTETVKGKYSCPILHGRDLVQFSPFTNWVFFFGGGYDRMTDNSAEILFQPCLKEAIVSSSGVGKAVHSLVLSCCRGEYYFSIKYSCMISAGCTWASDFK